MKKIIVSLFLVLTLVVPVGASAAGLSQQQIQAILGLLQSFGTDQNTINNVAQVLGYSPVQLVTPLSSYQMSSILEVLNFFGASQNIISNTQIALNGGSVSQNPTASLTEQRIQAIYGLLQTFGASQTIVSNVQKALGPALVAGVLPSSSSTILPITVLSPGGPNAQSPDFWQEGSRYNVSWSSSLNSNDFDFYQINLCNSITGFCKNDISEPQRILKNVSSATVYIYSGMEKEFLSSARGQSYTLDEFRKSYYIQVVAVKMYPYDVAIPARGNSRSLIINWGQSSQ